MDESNRIAFKEWSVICAALGSGRQSLILRKGGIHEGRAGFRVAHREFWLFPTAFHQGASALSAEGALFLPHPHSTPGTEASRSEEARAGEIPVELYAVVERVADIQHPSQLLDLAEFHIWSNETIHNRFHYRTPGLFALVVRMYRRTEPYRVPNLTEFAGCRSWVEFPGALATSGLEPVLCEEIHQQRMSQLLDRLPSERPQD